MYSLILSQDRNSTCTPITPLIPGHCLLSPQHIWMQSIVGQASGSTMRVCVFYEQSTQQISPAPLTQPCLCHWVLTAQRIVLSKGRSRFASVRWSKIRSGENYISYGWQTDRDVVSQLPRPIRHGLAWIQEVSEVGATVLGVLVDQLSTVKGSHGKADAKYFKGRLSD